MTCAAAATDRASDALFVREPIAIGDFYFKIEMRRVLCQPRQSRNASGEPMTVSTRLLVAAAAAIALSAEAASAATVSISNITSSWINIVPGSGITTSGNGTNNALMSWGAPASNNGQSGYRFQSSANISINTPPTQSFTLGTFTHINRPITGTVLTSATLRVALNLVIDGVNLGSKTYNFNFLHDETDNGANPCDFGGANNQGVNVNGCADRVRISGAPITDTLTVNGILYTLTLSGFQIGPNVLNPFTFLTVENQENSALLVGSISAVPVPAALPLFLAGIAGLGFARRRKANSANAV